MRIRIIRWPSPVALSAVVTAVLVVEVLAGASVRVSGIWLPVCVCVLLLIVVVIVSTIILVVLGVVGGHTRGHAPSHEMVRLPSERVVSRPTPATL